MKILAFLEKPPTQLEKWIVAIVWAGLMAGSLMLGAGCGTISKDDVPENTIAAATSLATHYVLTTHVEDKDRAEVSRQAFAISRGIRALASGSAPTGEDVQRAVLAFGGDKSRWTGLADALAGVYKDFYADHATDADLKAWLAILEAIARGVEDGAKKIADGYSIDSDTASCNTPAILPWPRPIHNPLPS